ncbi:transposase [Janthinobacterium fluminis]|uniref:Transposase n=1 Tax=Janthinobacterium fluminis TaxID=2987524 RepID=A0ABT5K302_9BURK|nr:transposase [Janthinobacterium fluminis]MDC8759289.1 transposase [Janthinobacterium fluminis]
MPRRARLVLPNVALHLIQRGNNRQPCFFADADYRVYLRWLAEHADASACRIHAYVLMSNHVHLLISADAPAAPAMLMKALGQQYVQYVNRRYQRSGSLWEGRYRSCLVQDETYLLVCQRYIELNPVRAGLVCEPAQYLWSSYCGNAEGRLDPILSRHPVYEAMGADGVARQDAYRGLFREALRPELLRAVRKATNGNFALGSEAFARQVEAALHRRAGPRPAGRLRGTAK